MSFVLNYIKNNPQETQISWSEVRAFRATHQAGHRFTYRKATGNSGRKSENHKGGGRKVKLSIEEQILLTLIYATLNNISIIRHPV